MSRCWYLLVGWAALAGCGRPADAPRATDPSAAPLSNTARAGAHAAPMHPPARPSAHFAVECFDVYAECEAVRGLPAVSADGARVAMAHTGPEDARDEFVLALVVFAADSGAYLERVDILTHEDRSSGLDPETGEMSAELRRTVQARVDAAERLLAEGGFTALSYLGTVHEERTGEEFPGMSASYDGRELVIRDQGEIRWRNSIGPVVAYNIGEATAHTFLVADIAVWASREQGVVLARVSYTTSGHETIDDKYLVWR